MEEELRQKQLETNKELMRKGKKDLNNSISQIKKRFKLKAYQGKKQKNEQTQKDKNTSGTGGSKGGDPGSSQTSGGKD